MLPRRGRRRAEQRLLRWRMAEAGERRLGVRIATKEKGPLWFTCLLTRLQQYMGRSLCPMISSRGARDDRERMV